MEWPSQLNLTLDVEDFPPSEAHLRGDAARPAEGEFSKLENVALRLAVRHEAHVTGLVAHERVYLPRHATTSITSALLAECR